MNILALDYDGVIVDSQLESFICGYNTYLKLTGTKKLKRKTLFTVNDLGYVEEERAIYLKYRPFFNKNLRFNLAMQLIEQGITVKTQEEFNNYGKNVKITNEEFKRNFHKQRELLQKQDYDKWFNLNKPFTIAINNFKKLIKEFDKTILLTANKKELIIRGLNRLGINVKLNDIFDAYISENKKETVDVVTKKLGVNYSDIYLIDDLFAWLPMLSKLGVNCFLATWGYNSEEQWKTAEKSGIIPVTQDNVYEKVMEGLKE